MTLPSGELIFWVMLELRHCVLRRYPSFEDSNLSKNSRRESANVLALCSSSKQFLRCLGHSLACKKPQSQPFVLPSNILTLQEPSLVLAEVQTDVRF